MQGGFFAYWWRVIMRSVIDAGKVANDAGVAPIKLLVAFAIVLLVCVIGSFFLGESVAERILWALGTMIAGVGLFLFILAIFVFRTPWKFENDAAEQHEKRLAAQEESSKAAIAFQEEKARTMLAKIDELGQLIIDSKMSHAQEVSALNADLARTKNADPKRNAMRHQVQQFIDQFKKIEQRAIAGERIGLDEFSPLESMTANYVNRHLHEHPFSHQSTDEDSPDAVKRARAWIVKLDTVLSFLE